MKKRGTIKSNSKIDETAWVVDNRTISSSVVKNKRIIIRCDFNVPVKNGIILDDLRIRASLDTLKFCLDNGAKQLILVSHLGRPESKNIADSLDPIAQKLGDILDERVVLAPSCIYSEFVNLDAMTKNCRVVLLENVRFHEQEEKNDVEFAKQLALFGDIYVNDAFGTAHRGHASNSAIASFLPSYIGFLMKKELANLSAITYKTKRPLVVILGFAKISDKINALSNLLVLADTVLIGGAVAFTFLAAQGKEVGRSKLEADKIPLARDLLAKYGKKIILPLDINCSTSLDSNENMIVDVNNITVEQIGFDVGPKTVKLFGSYVEKAKTIFWNGPVGLFEHAPYDKATNKLAVWIAQVTKDKGVISIVGGGDTASAAAHAGVANLLTHVSTGGGASLEFMEGKPLVAINAIYSSSAAKSKK